MHLCVVSFSFYKDRYSSFLFSCVVGLSIRVPSSPCLNEVQLGSGQAGAAVDPNILRRRHQPTSDSSADGGGEAAPLAVAIVVPFREVQKRPALGHVFVNSKRNRRNAGIPWPGGIGRMTILAGPLEHSTNRLRDVRVSQ